MNRIYLLLLLLSPLLAAAQDSSRKPTEKDPAQMSREEKIAAAKAKTAGSDTVKVAEMTPYEEAAKNYNEGLALEIQRQYDKAQLSYDKAIEVDPNFIEAYVKRGGIKFQKIEFAAAMEDYNRAIEITDNLREMHEYRAKIKNVLGDFDGSKVEASRGENMRVRAAEAYYQRGHLKRFMDDKTGGCTDIRKAFDLGYGRAKTDWPSLCQ